MLFEDDSPRITVAAKLLALGKQSDAVVIITADHPLVSQAIDELRITGARSSPMSPTSPPLAAQASGIRQTARESGEVFPLIGRHHHQCEESSAASFHSYMREHAPDVDVSDPLLVQEESRSVHVIVR